MSIQEMDLNEALELVHQYSPPGGMVMDLFAGTFVTSMACLRINRRSVAVEIDQTCVDAAVGRLKRWYKYLYTCTLLILGQCSVCFSVLSVCTV